ncbi:MAG: hypothetical protein HN612_06700 [Kordiimonadaceae bacterium]|jgi:D-3-phosphoglycerate dehydrogenase / 2-oxoglutarate reductase|nr:hypothetical protein [Kordiimonadaceae bacterium]
MQIGILESDQFSPEALDELDRLGEIKLYDKRDLATFLMGMDALFIRLGYQIDESFLSMAPKLRFLCSPTTGHNHIDEASLSARSIKLLTLKGEREFLETIRATPEHTFGLILSLLRNYKQVFKDTSDGKWERENHKGEELWKNNIGIIGLGRVGYRVANYCSNFGSNVYWHDIVDVPSKAKWQRMDGIRPLIEKCRVIVLCASYDFSKPPIIGKSEIDALRGKYFINTSRGELVDELYLLQAIKEGQLAGVAVDVIENENTNNRLEEWTSLANNGNIIVTPHIGGATIDSMTKTELFIAQKLARIVAEGVELEVN